jgi:hypothetical protein
VLNSAYVVEQISCAGLQDGEILATATGGNGGYIYQIGSLANSSGQFDNMSVGTYVLTVTDTLGCTAAAQTIQISAPTPLNLSMSPTYATSATAFDGMVQATVSGGTAPYQYLWSDPNAQTESLAVYLTEGMYTVWVTDANGCSIQDSVFMDILGLQTNTTANVMAYPNPTNGFVNFSETLAKLEVFDMQGRIVLTAANCASMNLSGLAAGTYQLVSNTPTLRVSLMVK